MAIRITANPKLDATTIGLDLERPAETGNSAAGDDWLTVQTITAIADLSLLRNNNEQPNRSSTTNLRDLRFEFNP